MNKEHLEILNKGVNAWNKWRDNNPSIRPDLSYADLSHYNLENINFNGANLNHICLYEANLKGASLLPVEVNVKENKTFVLNLDKGSKILTLDIIEQIQDHHSTVIDSGNLIYYYTDLRYAMCGGMNISNTKMNCVFFNNAVLANNLILQSKLSYVVFKNTNLINSNLTNSNIKHSFFINTNISNLNYNKKHNSLIDGSNNIFISKRDKYINWQILRGLSKFPIFAVAWSSLALSIASINFIHYLNNYSTLIKLDQFIYIPNNLLMVLIASLFLTIGSTIYKIYCPERVQQFSEIDWVERENLPRLQYYAKSWEKKGQLVSLISTLIGGVLSFYILFNQMFNALIYAIKNLSFYV